MWRALFIGLAALSLGGCIVSDADLSATLPAVTPFKSWEGRPIGSSSNPIKLTLQGDHYESGDSGQVKVYFFRLPEDPDEFVVEMIGKDVKVSYYDFARYDPSTGQLTLQDLAWDRRWMLPEDLQVLTGFSKDEGGLFVRGASLLPLLRGILRERVEQRPEARTAVYPSVVATRSAEPRAPQASSAPGRRVALVIGESNYRHAPFLANPAVDADRVATALRAAGFATEVKKDLARNAVVDALGRFAGQAAEADWALVYFAGHGLEMNGANYLVPVDARLETDTAVQFEAVPLAQATAAVDGARKLRLVILDACRADPFTTHMRRSSATRAPTRGLARPPEGDPGSLLLYAAKEGEVASDGEEGQGSPFSAALIREMGQPGLEIRRLFDVVSDDVIEATNGQQHPFTYGRLPGRSDFYFTPPAAR